MRVSELVREIIQLAEEKFTRPNEEDHANECIFVHMWCEVLGDDVVLNEGELVGNENWQVCLSRPTQRQLDSGYVYADLFHTVRTSEQEHRFHCQSSTLLDALYQLRDAVEDAVSYDW